MLSHLSQKAPGVNLIIINIELLWVLELHLTHCHKYYQKYGSIIKVLQDVHQQRDHSNHCHDGSFSNCCTTLCCGFT